jgi:5-methylcytosine-specific restriction endonuclease McrA
MNDSGSWQTEVSQWVASCKDFADDISSDLNQFFELAFENNQCPNESWLGIHKQAVSLVIGGIYLAAINVETNGRGIWLLIDRELDDDTSIEYKPVKSTQKYTPLTWLHLLDISQVGRLIDRPQVWDSHSIACQKILDSPIARNRDANFQESRGKLRLTQILNESKFGSLSSTFPDEVDANEKYFEGAVRRVSVNAYERDSKARQKCIEYYGLNCFICSFNFEDAFGKLGKGFIHVHHLHPISEIGEAYEVDPINDLRPICPNCHAMLHRRSPPLSIDELKKILKRAKSGSTA